MKISRLVIKNFRSIEEIDIPLPQVCSLVGPNNAGKSNILEAIRKILGASWVSANSFIEDDISYRDLTRDIEISCSFFPELKYKKFKEADEININTLKFVFTRYKVGEKKGQPRLEQKCLDRNGKSITVLGRAPKRGEQRKYEPLVGIPNEIREQVPLIYIGTNRSLKEQLPAARYSMLREMFLEINSKLNDPSLSVRVKRTDDSEDDITRLKRFKQLMASAMDLLKTDEFIAIERSIKRNALRQLGFNPDDTDKLDLYFTPMDTFGFYKSMDLLVTDGGYTGSATEMGEGFQNAIVLAILQAFEETQKQGAILLIEEPEMFLHPQMQRSLYKTIREIGKKNQVIYTTHSPHFVSLPDYDQTLVVKKGDKGTKIYASDLAIDNRRREKLIKELDPERGELFFARRLLLVEGDTEKLALPVYANRLGFDLDREGATIVEVGGKRNLLEIAKIAISFKIPTGIVYDTDSSDFSKNDKNKEDEYNKELNSFSEKHDFVQVWALEKNYEKCLRDEMGEAEYQILCDRFPNTGKPTRARLIALENNVAIPGVVQQILKWLVNKAE